MENIKNEGLAFQSTAEGDAAAEAPSNPYAHSKNHASVWQAGFDAGRQAAKQVPIEITGSEWEICEAAIKESRERYTLNTSRAAFQAGALFACRAALAQPNVQPKGTAVTDAQLAEAGRAWVHSVGTGHGPDFAAMRAAIKAPAPAPEPVAVRYDFDGYGWRYIDNGSGSDWMTRYPDGELLYDGPAPAVAHGWQPIETAPKDGTMLLLAGDNFGDPQRGQHVTVGSWRNERGWWEGLPDPVEEQMTANTQLQHLTHWMPLPDAPAFDVPVQGSGS